VGRNHIPKFFLVPVRKIISVQEINSESLFLQKNLVLVTKELKVEGSFGVPVNV
jgi:hypothetical protein